MFPSILALGIGMVLARTVLWPLNIAMQRSREHALLVQAQRLRDEALGRREDAELPPVL